MTPHDDDSTWPGRPVTSVPPGPQDTLPAPAPTSALDSDEPTLPGCQAGVRRLSERSLRAIDAARLAELAAVAAAEADAITTAIDTDEEDAGSDGP
ncbi:MAG: hypothetical protein NVS3B10_05760 [Polyangiales bacterium]